jgi:hypothetical protein
MYGLYPISIEKASQSLQQSINTDNLMFSGEENELV